jgi:lipid-A-disaccharide synthase
MLVAGEASGDQHGAALIRELKRRSPKARVFGLGGAEMARAGMDLRLDLAEKSVIGLVEVLKHVDFFRRAFHLAVKLLEEERPDLLILIDYPGFNLRLAEQARRLNIRICYYISPQVWAWKASRIPKMARLLDKMLVTFPFEKAIYDRAGLDCAFVGNPLLDLVKPAKPKAAWRKAHGIAPKKKLIGLLPGSRTQELRSLLPVMQRTARRMAMARHDLKFIVIKAPQLPMSLYALEPGDPPIEIFEARSSAEAYAARAACDFALVASGTATLETAMLKVPFIILYRVNWLTYFIGKRLVKVHSIGLANVVAGRRVVPEFLQDLDPQTLASEALDFLKSPSRSAKQLRDLEPGLKSLGRPGVAARAAKEALALL